MEFRGITLRAFAIDFDWTLIRFDVRAAFAESLEVLKRADAGLADELALRFGEDENLYRFHSHRVEIWRALLPRAAALRRRLQRTYWLTVMDTTRQLPGALEFLGFLHSEGIAVCVVTDTDGVAGMKRHRIVGSGISGSVDHIFIAGEDCRRAKPDVAVYRLMLATLKLDPNQCAMLGDHVENDMVPASLVGMHAIHFRSHYGGTWTPSVSSYRQLHRLFGRGLWSR